MSARERPLGGRDVKQETEEQEEEEEEDEYKKADGDRTGVGQVVWCEREQTGSIYEETQEGQRKAKDKIGWRNLRSIRFQMKSIGSVVHKSAWPKRSKKRREKFGTSTEFERKTQTPVARVPQLVPDVKST
ncbi:hypothetical protein RUM43_011985 [Polyplax serrata]|uniref:Uncharacterized protein n=1 Tax=Polyplax serrata TaxID=468196 RepID=A0AAN8PJ78_POLSC